MMSPLRLITDSVRALLDGHDAFGAAHAGAHEASTSPWNVLRPPTRAQQRAGNYPLGTVAWKGLTLRIENPAHTVREGVGEDSKPWRSVMKANYGYVAGTRGADGDGVDVFLGPFPESDRVWVLNQRDARGAFDEQKVLAGFVDERQAVDAYRLSYTPGWDRYGPPIPLSLKQLRWWLQYADLTRELTLDLVPPEPEDMNDTTDTIAATFDAAEDAFSPFYAQVSKETGLSVYELQDISDRGRMNWAGGARSALRDAEKRFSVAEGQAKKKGLTQDMKALFLREVDLSTRLIEKAKINLKASEMLLALAKGPKLDAVAPTLSRVFWDSAAEPMSGKTLGDVLYDIRASDGIDGLVMDAMTMGDITEGAELIMLDALVTLAGKLKPKMEVLMRVMEAAGGEVKPLALQLSEPMRRHGGVHVAALFELSDGQTITIWFHNPDSTPSKLTPADDLVSWKWQLNKKDITIVVAPESGQDLNLREVARRIMRLAAKNSPAFAKANGKRSAVMAEITGLRATLGERRDTLQGLMGQIEVAKVEADDRVAKKAAGPALPFLMTKDGKVTIFDGDTAQPLPDDWAGICVDGAKGVKDFWYIGRSGGERSFTKLRADNLPDATIEAQGVIAREAAEKAADAKVVPVDIPQAVKYRLDANLSQVKDLADGMARARQTDAKFGGGGRYGAETWRDLNGDERLATEAQVIEKTLAGIPDEAKRAAAAAYIEANRARPAQTAQEAGYFAPAKPEPTPDPTPTPTKTAADLGLEDASPEAVELLDGNPTTLAAAKQVQAAVKSNGGEVSWVTTSTEPEAPVFDGLFELDGARFVRGDITYRGRAMGSVTVNGAGKVFFSKPDGGAYNPYRDGTAVDDGGPDAIAESNRDAADEGLLGWTGKVGEVLSAMLGADSRDAADEESGVEKDPDPYDASYADQDAAKITNTIVDKSNAHWKRTLMDLIGKGKTATIGTLREGTRELKVQAVRRNTNRADWYITISQAGAVKAKENLPFPGIKSTMKALQVAAILMGYIDLEESSGFKIAPPGVTSSDLSSLYLAWSDEVIRTAAETGMTEPEASAMYEARSAEMKALWESGQGAAGAALKLLEALEPEPALTETAEAKFLSEVGAGVHDALDLGDMLTKIEASITAMKEAGQLAGDNDPVADAAILHWAALEEKANG